MAQVSPTTRTVRVRLIPEAAPPREHEGRPTEFGMKDKKRQAHPGQEQPDGRVRFEVEVVVHRGASPDSLDFSGPFVLGKPGERYLGLVWNYGDEARTIRGQKIRLDSLPWRLIDQATRSGSGIVQAEVVPITERTATIPVEWEVLPDSS